MQWAPHPRQKASSSFAGYYTENLATACAAVEFVLAAALKCC